MLQFFINFMNFVWVFKFFPITKFVDLLSTSQVIWKFSRFLRNLVIFSEVFWISRKFCKFLARFLKLLKTFPWPSREFRDLLGTYLKLPYRLGNYQNFPKNLWIPQRVPRISCMFWEFLDSNLNCPKISCVCWTLRKFFDCLWCSLYFSEVSWPFREISLISRKIFRIFCKLLEFLISYLI